MKYETDPSMPWVHGPEGYISRTELDLQMSNRQDIGADSPPEVMIARALAYRASELTRYKEEFDDESFLSYANDIISGIPGYIANMVNDEKDNEEKEWTHLSPDDQKFKALDEFLNRIDDGGWNDSDIMDIAQGGEQYYGQGPEGSETLSESRLTRLAGLNERLETARSEVGYSPTKASRHALHKARRASAADEIDAQLASMEPGDEDDRTIGDIVPIGYDEWESKKDRDKKRREERQDKGLSEPTEDRGETRQYLAYLALDVAHGKKEMSPDDIDALDILVHNEFRYSFAMDVTDHGPDVEAEYRRNEYYDDKEAGMYGEATIFNEARFVRLAGLNKSDRREK